MPVSGNASTVSVLTPTLESRGLLLTECRASVRAQTVPVEHLVMEDSEREGPQTIRNRLATSSESDWLLPLDDDDLLDPDCVEVLLAAAEGADIVYPFCRVEGRDDFYVVNKLWNERSLFLQPFIPVTALIRRDFFEMLGGYRNVPLEDYDLFKRAALHGARFVCVPEVVWSYRFLGQNTFQGAKAA
jgi:glycosyltransferase involved in cell wall biosynthesis